MTTVTQVCLAVQVREPRWSSSGDEWALAINLAGSDVLNATVRYRSPPFGTTIVTIFSEARPFPPEAFARVYSFGAPVLANPVFPDQVRAFFSLDTAGLAPSSIRFAIHGEDLIRPEHMLAWGLDATMAVVPLSLDLDMAVDVSEDAVEGPGSVPLRLVDSGDAATPLDKVVLYVALGGDRNAATKQPAAFRIEDADGVLLFQADLASFGDLQPATRNSPDWGSGSDDRDAKIRNLTGTTPPFRRVDARGRPVVPKLSVTGPDIESYPIAGVGRAACCQPFPGSPSDPVVTRTCGDQHADSVAEVARAAMIGADRVSDDLRFLHVLTGQPHIRRRAGDRLAIAAAAVSRHDLDLGASRHPGLDGGGLAVGKHIDDLAPLQVADDAAVAMPALPRPVVDADHPRRRPRLRRPRPDGPQQRVLAHRQQQASGQPLAGTAAEREAEMMDDGLQPRRAAGVGGDDVLAEPLGEDLPRADVVAASEPPHGERDPDAPAVRRQIGERSYITAVDPPREPAAGRAGRPHIPGPCGRRYSAILNPHLLDDQSRRQQRRR